jgi:pantothenate kinase-related protein Tda10
MNPLNLERGSAKEKRPKMKTFGFDSALNVLKDDIVSFFESEPDAPFLATVKGELGSGKSVFALNLIDELLVTDQFRYYAT